MKISNDARKYGLPHPLFRPMQKDAIEKALDVHLGSGGTIALEAPTGVGKSGIATGLGSYDNVTVLVHNLGLLKQYRDTYGFKIVMGKPEYPCVFPSKVSSWKTMYDMVPTAADCHFQDMYQCKYAYQCPYVQAREEALIARRSACTYKYASMSQMMMEKPGILVCDEAHSFYDELLAIAQFQMDQREAMDHDFPKLPLFEFGPGGNGDLLEGVSRLAVKKWFDDSISKVSVFDLFNEMTPDGVKNKKILDKLTAGMKLLESDQPLFYRCSKPAEDWRFDSRQARTTMQIRSLDVTEKVNELRSFKKTTVMMSATIGNPKPLMEQLGITEYKFHNYPHPVPKDKRPVYDLGCEKMTKANLDARPSLYATQAYRIADLIEGLDPEWRGIVLTTSNFKITQLRKHLQQRLNGRVMIPREPGLNAQIREFMTDPTPGKVAVVTIQGWGTGLSLVGNIARYSIVAGVPYANPGDRFDQLRMSTTAGRNYTFYTAYNAVVQANGRVSRGEQEDDGSFMLNVGAIADGSATSPIAMQSYSQWYKESIVRWKPRKTD